MKKSFDNIFSKKINRKNSKSLTIIKSKSSKQNQYLSKKPSKNKIKESSNKQINDIINNILTYRKEIKYRNNISKNKINKTHNSVINYILNRPKTSSNSIRCSFASTNRYSYFPKQKNYKSKQKIRAFNGLKPNRKISNQMVNNYKWSNLLIKLESLKIKTNSLLNKYYNLTEILNKELKILNQNCDKNKYINDNNEYRVYISNNKGRVTYELDSKKYMKTETYY